MGFRLEDPFQEPARSTIDTGDPLLKLITEFPLSVRLDGFAAYKEDAFAEMGFEWPWTFKILSGGNLNEKISYYFYYTIEKGGGSGLEEAYLQFNKPFGLSFDLLLGQFQVSDPLFKRELKLERNDYLIYKVAPGYFKAGLTYDRGIMVSSSLGKGIDFVLGIYNGSGIGFALLTAPVFPYPKYDIFDNSKLKESSTKYYNYDIDKDKSFSSRFVKQFGPVRFGIFGY